MREITSHKGNGLNDAIRIEVRDEPGHGNACHDYFIAVGQESGRIKFQNGLIHDSQQGLVADAVYSNFVEDRLQGFQSGEFACRENAIALTKIQESLMWLQRRVAPLF